MNILELREDGNVPLDLELAASRCTPELLRELKDFAFYLWAVCLTLAITSSTHALVHTDASLSVLFGIGLAALTTCTAQFALGRRVGLRIGEPIAPAQALGQKNTVFAIWAGYTFFDPVSSIAGGFYSIFHNVWNSYQLSQNGKRHLARVAPEMSPPRS